MAKTKTKNAKSPVSLRHFLANPVNIFIIIPSIMVALLVIAVNIPNLSFSDRSELINCNGEMRRIELFDSDIQQVHHYAKVYIWFAAIVLMLVLGLIVYRNIYWKSALVAAVILLLLYVMLGQIGQGLKGIACLSF